MNTLYSQDQECLLVLGGFFEVIVIPIMTTIRCQYTIIGKPLKTWIWQCFLKEGGTHWLLFYVRMKSDKLWPQKLLTQKLATKCWLHFFPRKNLFSQIFFYKHLLSEKNYLLKLFMNIVFIIVMHAKIKWSKMSLISEHLLGRYSTFCDLV